MNIKISYTHFILGIFIGVISLFLSIQPVQASSLPLLTDLLRLFRFGRISPLRPLLPLPSLAPLRSPFGTPRPTFIPSPTLSPALIPTSTPRPSVTSSPTPSSIPTPSKTPVPTQTPMPSVTPGLNGLVSYWKMEEGAGTIVVDSSGNGHTLTLGSASSAPSWVNDQPPTTQTGTTSLLFDGVDDVAFSSSDPAFNLSTGYTIEAWIKADTSQSGPDKGIVARWEDTSGTGYMIWMDGNGRVNNVINRTFLADTLDSRDNVWHHVAIVWDGNQKLLYRDGELKVTEVFSGPLNSPNIALTLGNYPGVDPFRNFHGNIDEVKIFNTARTQTEIIDDAGLVGRVVINEIMWMGSNSSASDEWIELRNMTGSPIDLTNWTVEKLGTGTSSITIPNGTIAANGFFLISNNTRANSILDVDPDYQTASISLDNAGEQLILKNSGGVVIDSANGTGAWLAGDNTVPKKSMERNNPPGDGTAAANWHSASTSVGLDSGATESATPKNSND